ncbi:hypothetical protein DFH09DRAFT_1188422 [Mycena vulgaris]|nr:hypothetical protein DFH09DRAFT_1188422 [Mycena vulgaris]
MMSSGAGDPIATFSSPAKPPSASRATEPTRKRAQSKGPASKRSGRGAMPVVDRRPRVFVESAFPKTGAGLLRAGKSGKLHKAKSLAQLVEQGRHASAALKNESGPRANRPRQGSSHTHRTAAISSRVPLAMVEAGAQAAAGTSGMVTGLLPALQDNGLAQAWGATEGVGPFRRSQQAPGLSDISAPAALDLGDNLVRRACGILNDEQRWAFARPPVSAGDPIYVTEHGFLTQTRPPGSSMLYGPSNP